MIRPGHPLTGARMAWLPVLAWRLVVAYWLRVTGRWVLEERKIEVTNDTG